MIKNDKTIMAMIFDPIKTIMEEKNIDENAAKKVLSEMSFNEYRLLELNSAITPPSGDTIAPGSTHNQKAAKGPEETPTAIKSIWPGKGAPIEMGMTVGITGDDGKPLPGEVSKVDLSANGVMVKNPTTGKSEWMNTDNLEPYAIQEGSDAELCRLKELAGIKENASCGATGAGAIAVAPTAMGGVKKRQSTEEKLEKEYTPKGPAKTIIGDTKPNQATGELSSTLARNGKKTASRKNNGKKKTS